MASRYERLPTAEGPTAASAPPAEEGVADIQVVVDDGKQFPLDARAGGGSVITLQVIRIGEPHPMQVPVNTQWSVRQLKEQAFAREMAEEEKFTVRVIYQGKRMSDEQTLASYGVSDKGFVHCSVAERSPEDVAALAAMNGEEEGGNVPEGSVMVNGVLIPRWMLGDARANMLLAQQQARRGGAGGGGVRLAGHPGGGGALWQQRRLGTSADFLLGVVMGTVLGPLSLIWVCQRIVPARQKLGIVLGLFFYMLFRMSTVPQQNASGGAADDAGAGSEVDEPVDI